MTYKDYVTNLKREIETYVKMGGNIYDGKRVLPYYEKIRYATKLYKSENDVQIEIEDVYKDCGIKFNRDYNNFLNFTRGLEKFADKNGFVDQIKKSNASKEEVELKSFLDFHARETGISPGEYLILMTNFRYKTLVIAGDYVKHLQEKIQKEIPDGVVRNLKRTHSEIYYGIKHFQKYSPQPISYNEALDFFGLIDGNIRTQAEKGGANEVDEDKLLASLSAEFPDKKIDAFSTSTNYRFVVRAARSNDQTINQWLDNHGFDYTSASNVLRLSKFQVDATEHEQKLMSMREELLKEYNTKNADDVDMFVINSNIAKRIGNALYKDDQTEQSQVLPASPMETFEQ